MPRTGSDHHRRRQQRGGPGSCREHADEEAALSEAKWRKRATMPGFIACKDILVPGRAYVDYNDLAAGHFAVVKTWIEQIDPFFLLFARFQTGCTCPVPVTVALRAALCTTGGLVLHAALKN
ncbi:uncharacterized protein TrAtP1_003255 [Trichoderma atroviride]|uniref:uncharacterized protein n=1 Tax=Hypocrea atroviridis TaxID=63577 RepID=UPI00332DC741|nr:hypothetical protein TrAtP1_003255 [Trichoderma atroviride]